MQERLLALDRGQGGLVFLLGEPGIGKSRLLGEMHVMASADDGPAWVEGRCVSYSQAVPYSMFRDLLRSWLGVAAADSRDRIADELRLRVSELDMSEDNLGRALLAATLGAAIEPEGERQLVALSPEARRFRTAEAIRDLTSALASRGALVCAIEDIHWADTASLQVLESLFSLTNSLPLLIAVTHRSERDHPSWSLHRRALENYPAGVEVVNLQAVPAAEERHLLEALVGKGTLPESIQHRVLGAAEGNPLYLEEVIRSLIDAGSLVKRRGRWRFEQEKPVAIPPTVERVILSRIDRLSSEARSTIQIAAVIGRAFRVDLLGAVADSEGATARVVSELVQLELLREAGRGEYRFKHALIQEAAYSNIVKRQRRELHGRVADAVKLLRAERLELHYAELAHHCRMAERPVEALGYFELAAEDARRVYAVDAALQNFAAALEIAEAINSERVAALRLQVGKVRSQAGHVADARNDFEEVLRIAREHGDGALEIDAMNELGFLLAGAVNYQQALDILEQARARAESLGLHAAEVAASSRLSIVYTNHLRLDLAVDRANRAVTKARDLGDDRLLGIALDALQVASVMVGDMATVDHVSENLVRIHRHRGDLWYLQTALFQWAWVDMAAGRWPEAERRFAEGVAVNRRIEDRGSESMFPAVLCWLSRVRGDYQGALARGRQGVELATAVGHTEFISWAAELLGWTLLDLFAVEEAVPHLERALEAATTAGARLELIRAASHLSLARWLAADRERAMEVCADAERWIGEVTAPPGRVYLQGADGPIAIAQLHVLRGEPLAAMNLALPILQAALAADWHEVVAAASLVLARAQIQLRDHEAAVGNLELSIARAEDYAMLGVAWRAHAELAKLLKTTALPEALTHASRSRELVDGLASAIEDVSIRGTFIRGAHAVLAEGEPA